MAKSIEHDSRELKFNESSLLLYYRRNTMYFRRYIEDTKHYEWIEGLFRQYKKMKITSRIFSLQEIENILKNKYLAEEIINDHTYLGLIDDPMVNVNNIFKMYKISDFNILNSLYIEEEKKMQRALANEDFIIENDNDLSNISIMQGKLIRIALESEDGKTLSGYTQQGECKKIAAELFVLGATVNKEDIDIKNEWFQEYLEALVLSGYLSEDAD